MTEIRPFDPALFHDAAIDPDTANLNAQMIELLTGQPEWVVGAQAARAARQRGEGPFPAPVFSERARTMTITGKDRNQLSLRVIAPAQPRGVYLHLHGSGIARVLAGCVASTGDHCRGRVCAGLGTAHPADRLP